MTTVKFRNLLALLFLFIASSSQAQRLTCTTHSHTDEVLSQNPERLALREQLRREIDEYLATEDPTRGGEPDVRVIPTVFHVIHDNGSENLSKQTLLNALEAVNLELRGQNSSVSTVVPPFNNNIGDSYHELRLAKIDVNGDCTDGITRTVSDQTYAAGEDVKDLINWNTGTRRYLQVWVVNTVGSGAGGYTYLPGSVSAYRNGIILRAAQFQSSLTHEFGHWLNLAHTWGPTNENAVGSNCSFDDGISDTPNTIGSEQVCNVNQESCGSLDNVQNHMDYSSCARMFTGGQANEMYAASTSTVGGRNYYWGSTNRSQTGTSDGFTNTCVPNVEFAFEDAVGCEGLEVQFEDNSWGADEDGSWEWNWSFPGGTPSSSNAQNPTVTYNTGGTYDVSLTITTNAGSDSYTVSNAIEVEAVGGGIEAVYQEGMENADFPDNSDPSLEWTIESPGGLTWQRTQSAAFTGSASARINLRSISTGNENNLISPPIDMSDVEPSDARMYFRLAHANRTSDDHNEQLRVYVSRDCGTNWTLRYTESGDDLNTAGANVSGTFVPNENQWREESVSLASVAGDEHVLIRFEATSDRQSYLYIDDININPNHSVGVEEIESLASDNIYPNPIDGTSQLELRLTEADEFTFKLVNVLGKEIATFGRNLNVGLNRISLSEFGTNLNAGFYFIQMNTESGQKSIRFVKN